MPMPAAAARGSAAAQGLWCRAGRDRGRVGQGGGDQDELEVGQRGRVADAVVVDERVARDAGADGSARASEAASAAARGRRL